MAVRSTSGDMVFHVHLAEDGTGLRGACDGAARAQPAGAQERVLGGRAERRHRPRDRRALPLQGDARAQGARNQGRGHTGAHRRGARSPAPASGRAAPPAARRVPVGQRLLPGQRPQPGRPGRRRGQDAPPKSSARYCRRSSIASRKPRRRRPTSRRASTRCSPPRTCRASRGLRQSRPAARREGQDRLPGRKWPAEGGPATVSRSAPTTATPPAAATSTDEFAKEPFGWDFEVVRLLVLSLLRAGKIEATSKGQTLRLRDRCRGARHLLEQQPLPPGLVPPEERASSSKSW